jgi:hypothetical protein
MPILPMGIFECLFIIICPFSNNLCALLNRINPYYLLFPILISNKYTNIVSWTFPTLIQHYMSIPEQLMYASEQK